MRRNLSLSLMSLFLASAMLTGCKQNEGERCEVTTDCADGLICDTQARREGTCQLNPSARPQVDAAIAPAAEAGAPAEAGAAGEAGAASDAGVTDGAPTDASGDAGEAGVDLAAPAPDAPPAIDAAPATDTAAGG